MNELQQRLGVILSTCVDLAKGSLGEAFAVTLVCRHRSGPAHILIGDDRATVVMQALEELERFGTKLKDEGEEQPEQKPATDRMADMLREARDKLWLLDEGRPCDDIAKDIDTMLVEMLFDEAPAETVHMPDMRDGAEFTRAQHHLIDWLSKEDASSYGECKGADLDSLIERGLVEWKNADSRGEDYGRVGLTEAGYAKARELGERKP